MLIMLYTHADNLYEILGVSSFTALALGIVLFWVFYTLFNKEQQEISR